MIGPGEPIPSHLDPTASVDYEGELAVVIGRGGRGIRRAEALEHVFGYTILNDWSARDLQMREMAVRLGPAKGKDSATTLGPWLVTADELESHRDDEGFLALEMRVCVNGVEIGHDLLRVRGERREDRVGVWVKRPDKGPGFEDKIAAIGIRVRRWVTLHGIAINVEPELVHFSGIVPCGVSEQRYGVTSLADLGLPVSMAEVDMMLRREFESVFGPTA